MDMKKIRELVKAVEESEINELIIEENDTKITIRKGFFTAVDKGKVVTEEGSKVELSEEVEAKYPDTWKEFTAPMVGTFYRASHPDAPPFVEEGDEIEEGQTVCILEAMKLMNEIVTEEAGVIKKILVGNGASIEYGQVLFLYEPK